MPFFHGVSLKWNANSFVQDFVDAIFYDDNCSIKRTGMSSKIRQLKEERKKEGRKEERKTLRSTKNEKERKKERKDVEEYEK